MVSFSFWVRFHWISRRSCAKLSDTRPLLAWDVFSFLFVMLELSRVGLLLFQVELHRLNLHETLAAIPFAGFWLRRFFGKLGNRLWNGFAPNASNANDGRTLWILSNPKTNPCVILDYFIFFVLASRSLAIVYGRSNSLNDCDVVAMEASCKFERHRARQS